MIQGMTCPNCGKPYCTSLTFTSIGTTWPYCRCYTHTTITFTVTDSTTMTGWGEIAPDASGKGYLYSYPETEVPNVFQEAFKDGELDI